MTIFIEPMKGLSMYSDTHGVSYNEVLNGHPWGIGGSDKDHIPPDNKIFLVNEQWREKAFNIHRWGLVFNTVGLEKPKNVTLEAEIKASSGEKVLVYQLAQKSLIIPSEDDQFQIRRKSALQSIWKQRPPEVASFWVPAWDAETQGEPVTLTVSLPPEVITPNETTLLFRLAAEGQEPPPPAAIGLPSEMDAVHLTNVRLIIEQ